MLEREGLRDLIVVVTETGCENFTDFLPSKLEDIEKLTGGGGANTSAMLDWTDEQWDAIRPKKK